MDRLVQKFQIYDSSIMTANVLVKAGIIFLGNLNMLSNIYCKHNQSIKGMFSYEIKETFILLNSFARGDKYGREMAFSHVNRSYSYRFRRSWHIIHVIYKDHILIDAASRNCN